MQHHAQAPHVARLAVLAGQHLCRERGMIDVVNAGVIEYALPVPLRATNDPLYQ